ncbi:hypothetical protein ASE74_15310 [Pedobacter sp. Leaf216]|uniref:hypothetical protein n=1 Tax=Pedobacter sp. Leaf216 TaxID=1735684 RepID=UPI000701D5C8|nr:hypothetical protein [Pedobacter sp. Leaf216]KQM78077.1 hypothetical protein ASE74_15310 [Pedobacter sp. Leaf216]
MWKAFFSLFLLLILSFERLKAQQGCLIGTTTGGTFYIDTFLGYYQVSGRQYQTSAPACPRVQLLSRVGSCQFVLFGPEHDLYTYTFVTATSSPIACPLTEYILLLSGFYGAYRLRKYKIYMVAQRCD